ncbi:uncharacterized protein LOC123878164 isoform X2 [Maniola jurtina]|uniref:uncharacterized protein LOC123878164 isoform X2 n=1 Tax=Maniola jurtina TaxID=191418 RepID=UPI001E68C2A5|nr:uncharacterized protein LOC123878164 isoform X2 [Maniola jurtina]
MSVIALAGVPRSITNSNVGVLLKHMKSSIKGDYEFMNFIIKGKEKTAFLRLSEKLDPQEVVENINSRKRIIYAYIPEDIPDFPYKKRQRMSVSTVMSSVYEIMEEMQSKFAGLHDLSASTAHKLLNEIAKTVFKRLQKILDQKEGSNMEPIIKLTRLYRKKYPHFTDFQLILSILCSIQDAEGKPRYSIQESDLTSYKIQSYVVDNIPFDMVQNAYTKYLDKITLTVTDHIKNLEMTPRNTSPEEIARIKIREQLQTLLPYLPVCMRHATYNYFIPQESNFYKVHIYGEPALPSQEALSGFLKRHKVMSTKRSDRMYNKVYLEVPKSQYMILLDADGTYIGSCKLVIRPSNLPIYKLPRIIVKEMQRKFLTAGPV